MAFIRQSGQHWGAEAFTRPSWGQDVYEDAAHHVVHKEPTRYLTAQVDGRLLNAVPLAWVVMGRDLALSGTACWTLLPHHLLCYCESVGLSDSTDRLLTTANMEEILGLLDTFGGGRAYADQRQKPIKTVLKTFLPLLYIMGLPGYPV